MADKLQFIASRFEPKIRRALLKAFEAMKKKLPISLIEQRLKDQGLLGVMSLLDNMETDLSGELSDDLENAIKESGRMSVQMMPKQALIGEFHYTLFNETTAAVIRSYELNLIRQISEQTREAVRRGLQADIVSGRNPLDTARIFRSNLGLTERQEQAVRNYRNALENLDRNALERSLRDKRFDSSIRRAIKDNKSLTSDQINHMVQRYRERYIQYRSRVIARTESLRAVSIGHKTAMDQMIAQGAIDGTLVKRYWVYTSDSRTRPDHRRIPSMNKEGVAINEPFKTPDGPLMYPRDPNGSAENTIQCRCTVVYRMADEPAPPVTTPPKKK